MEWSELMQDGMLGRLTARREHICEVLAALFLMLCASSNTILHQATLQGHKLWFTQWAAEDQSSQSSCSCSGSWHYRVCHSANASLLRTIVKRAVYFVARIISTSSGWAQSVVFLHSLFLSYAMDFMWFSGLSQHIWKYTVQTPFKRIYSNKTTGNLLLLPQKKFMAIQLSGNVSCICQMNIGMTRFH